MATRSTSRERYSFANLDERLEMPDLLDIQRRSFEHFLKVGLAETFRDISPIEDFSGNLRLELEYDPEDELLCPPPKFTVEECREKGHTYQSSILVRARFSNRSTGEIREQLVFMGDFPMMTEKGTFIVNGTERVVVSQLVRSPGVIFEPGERYRLRNLSKHQLVKGTIHPQRGEWLEFDVEQKPGKDVTAGTRVARKRRMSVFSHPRRTRRWSRSTSVPVRVNHRRSSRHVVTSRTPSSTRSGTTFRGWAVTRSTASSVTNSPSSTRTSVKAPERPESSSRPTSTIPTSVRSRAIRTRPTCCVRTKFWRPSRTCSISSSRSRATASTIRTISPIVVFVRWVNSSRTRFVSACHAWSVSFASA
ncbi:MAG: hypothetical protein EBS22_10570 [Acidimicrobiia bacterium]|nr:hypothetical protein [Acidimicrobiia bacterium]